MTPKEKAEELFDKYYKIFEDDQDEHFIDTSKRISKLSALIVVDEIIQSQKCCNECKYEGSIEMKFWQQVKHEITNL